MIHTFLCLQSTIYGEISEKAGQDLAVDVIQSVLDKALMLGVDIYKLTAMHYVEGITPDDINKKFEPTDEINQRYLAIYKKKKDESEG